MRSIEIISYLAVTFIGASILLSEYRLLPRGRGSEEEEKSPRYMKVIGFAMLIGGSLNLLVAY